MADNIESLGETTTQLELVEKHFISHLNAYWFSNLELLLSGKFFEFMNRNLKFLDNYCEYTKILNELKQCYNIVPPQTSQKFISECYLTPEARQIWDSEPVNNCNLALALYSRKEVTQTTITAFNQSAKLLKSVALNEEKVREELLKDFEAKKQRLETDTQLYIETENLKKHETMNMNEAIIAIKKFLATKTFVSRQPNSYFLNVQKATSWYLMFRSAATFFRNLFGAKIPYSECCYLQVTKEMNEAVLSELNGLGKKPNSFGIYLVWGGAPRTTLLNYKICDDKISGANFVVTCNSAETLIHEIYHCVQFSDEFVWRIPADLIEYGAIRLERKYRRKKSSDYSPYRQLTQIAYGIASLQKSAEGFDKEFNELMGLNQDSHFSRQFIPILSMGSIYYAYSLAFMDEVPAEFSQILVKYQP